MITDNYSITQLFYKKELKMILDKEIIVKLQIPAIADFLDGEELYTFLEIISWEPYDIKKNFGASVNSKFEFLNLLFFTLAKYSEFFNLKKSIEKELQRILKNQLKVDYVNKEFTIHTNVGDVIITPEIWDYIVYLLQLTYGKKVVLPPTFSSEEERKFYEAQKAAEAKIAEIRSKNNDSDDEILIKMLLCITYKFPSLTFDYLFNQTMAQIHWLHNLAKGSVSYEVNAQACAMGNMKKNQKLDFFIK